MKAHLLRAIFAAATAVSLGTLLSQRLLAQACQPFLLGVVLSKIDYISLANSEGDRLVVGEWNPALGEVWWDIPYPTFPKQTFCGVREIAPGLLAEAYVPGDYNRDFSSFGVSLLDPLTRKFDSNSGRATGPAHWRWGFRADADRSA